MSSKARPTGTAAQRQARVAAMRAAQTRKARKARQRRAWWISGVAVALVVVVIGVLVAVKVSSGRDTPAAVASGPASAAVVQGVTGVPAATLAKIGAGSAQKLPTPISAPALTADGKPRVLYIGAEYCPYCAAERWPMVVALSRFGTWSQLQATSSSASDVFPRTPTLSFHGSAYASDLVSFTGVEETTNIASGNGYTPLDTPSAADSALLARYDAPPYLDASSAGAIPFVDLGGKYMISGASYSPQVLAGRTREQVAATLTDPNSPIATAIDGTANAITAAICELTNQKPTTVCNERTITQLQSGINAQR